MIETNEMYRRDPNVRDPDDDHIRRIPSLLRGNVGNCATSEVILIVLVLYFLVPPMGVLTDVTTHVNPIKNRCKPWGKNTHEKNENKIIFVFP